MQISVKVQKVTIELQFLPSNISLKIIWEIFENSLGIPSIYRNILLESNVFKPKGVALRMNQSFAFNGQISNGFLIFYQDTWNSVKRNSPKFTFHPIFSHAGTTVNKLWLKNIFKLHSQFISTKSIKITLWANSSGSGFFNLFLIKIVLDEI